MSREKISEMFLRDGLQSLRTIYTVREKIAMFDILNKCNYDCIEFGSTTSSKLIPQVGGSMELWNHVRDNSRVNTKYSMLVPSIKHMPAVLQKDINSYGFVLSISDTFSKRNMKMSSEESIKHVKAQINGVIDKYGDLDTYMRIYLSCSFGCPWEGLTVSNLEKTKRVVKELTDIAHLHNLSVDNFDIVLADTVGMCDKYTMNAVLKTMYDLSYVGLHLHLPGKKNKLDIEQERKFRKMTQDFIYNNFSDDAKYFYDNFRKLVCPGK